MSDPAKAVFLSYASQDAEAARRICDALRAAGVEVWFDTDGGLEHGDEWDAKIRRQIKECVLFLPIISANTQAREEGYFRLEWDLAAERARTIASGVAFILPVVIDDTKEPAALVPDRFRSVQWTKLPDGHVPPDVLQRFLKLWSHRTGALKHQVDVGAALDDARGLAPTGRRPAAPLPKSRRWLVPAGVLAGLVIAALVFWPRGKPTAPVPDVTPAPAVAAAPPALSPSPGLSEAQKLTRQAKALLDDDPLVLRENYFLADELAQRAVKADPTDGEAWAIAGRASVLLASRKFDASATRRDLARLQVERAMSLAPASLESAFAQALQLASTDRNAEARVLAEELTRRAPGDWRFWNALGGLYSGPQEREKALGCFREAMARSGGDARPTARAARVLLSLGHLAECKAEYERMMAGKPSRDAYLGGLLFWGIYIYDFPAAKAFIARIPPRVLQEDAIISTLAEFYLRTGEGDRALEELERMPRDFFEDGWDWRPKGYLAGYAHQIAGRTTAAQAEWQRALVVVEKRLTAEPNENLLLYWKCLLQALTGQTAEARVGRQLWRELDREPNAWFDAVLLVAIGDREAAIEELEKGWPKPDDVGRFDYWGDVLYAPWFAAIREDPRIRKLAMAEKAAIDRQLQGPAGRAVPDEKSVAVLAFANLSDDKANEYFSDGISEELLNVLAKVPGLKVTARTSSFYFKGKETPIPEIAQKLGVAYVVEGSVRKQGDKVRITAQLIKAADGFHVWSDTFTRDLKDVFAVQDEIAGLIAQNLRLTMGASAPGAKTAVNPEAFELYVEARQAWNLRTPEGFDRAEELLNRALVLEPGFARAHAALSDVWGTRGLGLSQIGQFGQRESPLMRRIIAAAERAVALDPNSAEAQASLGNAYANSWRLAEGTRTLRHAVALNPNYASAHQFLGRTLLTQGYFEEAAAELARAAELDPLSHRIIDNYAIALVAMGRPTEGLAATERALALRPDSVQAGIWRARCLAKLGRHEEAVAQARRVKADGGPQSVYLVEVFAAAGLKSVAEEILAKLDRKFAGWRFVGLLELGRYEEALAAMNPAEMSPQSFYQANLDPVREDPRFKQVLATLGLTEADARMQAWSKAHPKEMPEAKK